MTQPTQDPKSDYFGFFDEASQLDPKDLAKITLPKQVKGKIEYHSTPATKPLDELLSNPDKSNTTKSGFEITFDPVHLRAEIQALITNAEKQARLDELNLLANAQEKTEDFDVAFSAQTYRENRIQELENL